MGFSRVNKENPNAVIFLPCDEENDLQKSMNNTPNTVSTSLLIPELWIRGKYPLTCTNTALMRSCLFMLFNWSIYTQKSIQAHYFSHKKRPHEIISLSKGLWFLIIDNFKSLLVRCYKTLRFSTFVFGK